ncbi:MAG: PRC-barrel domain-containing protein [Pseudomonadota bacterium]
MSYKTLLAATTALSLTAGFAFASTTDASIAAEENEVTMNAETQSEIAQSADGDMEEADQLTDEVSNNQAAQTAEEVSDVATNDGAEGGAIEGMPEMPEDGMEMAEGEASEDSKNDMADSPSELLASPFIGMTVGELIGMNVDGSEGDTVGEIDYIISRNGGMEAVIGVGGVLGLGEHTVAVPLSAFAMGDDTLTIEETEASLREMPEIDESEIEGLSDETPIS